jgi:putative addiction module killer protein
MEAISRTIEIFKTSEGKRPFWEWLEDQNLDVQGIVEVRLKRVEKGLFGNHHSEGNGVWALIFDEGPGHRVYYALTANQRVVLLLTGGGKKRQNRDIQQAIAFWEDYKKNDMSE